MRSSDPARPRSHGAPGGPSASRRLTRSSLVGRARRPRRATLGRDGALRDVRRHRRVGAERAAGPAGASRAPRRRTHLIDCGEGTQRQLAAGRRPERHHRRLHHAPACRPLAGVARAAADLQPARPRADADDPWSTGAARADARDAAGYGRLGFELDVVELAAGDAVRRDTLEIQAVNVRHRVLAYGYVLVEDARPGRFDAGLAEQLGVTPGPDFGRLQRGETVAGVRPRAGGRAGARGAQDRRVRRHGAVRDPWRSRPTGPIC